MAVTAMQIVKADFTLKKVRKQLLQNNQVKDTTTFKLDNLNSFNHSSTLLALPCFFESEVTFVRFYNVTSP